VGCGVPILVVRAADMMGGPVKRNVEYFGVEEPGDLVRIAEAQGALRRIGVHVARGGVSGEVLDLVAEELGRLVGADGAQITRYAADGTATVVGVWGTPDIGLLVGTRLSLDGHSVSATVLRTGQAARMDSYADVPGSLAAHQREHHVRGTVGAPIFVEGRLWGVVTASVVREEEPLFAPGAEVRLAEYADLVAAAIANAQARADLAASRARVVAAADQARRRIERELHDGIQQQLIALAIELTDVEVSIPSATPEQRERLSAVTQALTGILDELREISRGIHPTILSGSGLQPALKGLGRRCRVPVEFDMRFDRRLPEPVEVAAYYIVVEALANAAKHADASHVRIEASVRDARLHLCVRDDGVGGADPSAGSGLIGLSDRVDALGGSITIDSPPGHGTCLEVELPLELTPKLARLG